MSISGSLANAFSGLTAASRGAETISQNLANALTEGYGRRELQLSSGVLGRQGAGVRVDGIARAVNQTLVSDRRLADAAEGRDTILLDARAAIEAALGQPDAPGSLTARYAEFEAALVAAASRPDSGARLAAVAETATALARALVSASRAVQNERSAADAAIAASVSDTNAALGRIAELNRDIQIERSSGRDPSGLIDARQRLIDRVSAAIPLREVPRDDGQVALYSTGGAVLLDGTAAELGFAATATITADMTLASGALSGLTLRGRPVTADATGGLLGGGTLGALFAVRDGVAPSAQAGLDALARDLVERFEAPAADPTRTGTAPGLFTDRGAILDPLNETGLAGRLQVNVLVDPAFGGEPWRLRDGLGATAPGPVGQAAGLQRLADALAAERQPVSGAFSPGPRTAAGLAAELLADVGTSLETAEVAVAHSAARREALIAAERAGGVDSDQELQHLLLVEQAYSANARVVAAAEAMLDRLMEI